MPNYDYKCSNCDKVVEIKHSMLDNQIRTCSDCGSVMNKIYTGGNVSMNTPGFYSYENRKNKK